MAKKSENFKSEEYIKLSETLLQNADILTGKLGSLKRDGESLKRTYESLFSMPKDDLDFLLETNSHFAELYEDLKKQLIEHNELVNRFSTKITNVAKLYGISNEQAKDSLILAKEYFDINQKKEIVNEKIKKTNEDILDLQQELIDLANNGQADTKYYEEVCEKLDEAHKDLLRNKVVSNDINQSFNRINTTISNNPIAKSFVKEIEDGNVELGTSVSLLNKMENSTENINKAKAKSVELGEKANEVTKAQNEKLAVALNILKGIWGLVKDGGNKWIEIDDNVSKVGRSIGLATNQIRGYQKNILDNYSDMAAKLGMTTEEMMKFQENYTKNTGRAIMLTNEQVSSLGAMSRLVGDVATNDMVKNMDDFGASTQTATSYLALNMARARSQGLDAQKASEAFSKNVKLASQYNFREGVNGISKMTLLSQKLKFNMESIANAADKFETIEGAIGTSANLQVLGGSFAAQFGNPLEAMNMAMLDMEGFTNKIVDTFSNKAIFNRETGQVEMSAIDKRFLKEAAKNLGISYEEAWNMASQQAKIGDVERQINKTQNFSEEDKNFITSKTQYNAETKQHYVTFYDAEGKEQNVDVKDLTSDQLDIMRSQKDVETAMYSDVHGMHSILKAYVEKEAGDTRSLKEIMTGAKESKDVAMADNVDLFMNIFKQGLGWLTTTLKNFGEWFIGATILFKSAKAIFSSFFGNSLTKLGKKSGIKVIDTIGNFFGGKGKGTSSGGPTPPGGPTPHSGGSGGPSRTSFWGKAKNAFKGKKGKVGLAIGAATLIASGLGLMSAADGSQVDKSKLGGREVEPNDINPNELESTSVNKTEELTELEKQTLLLKTIAEKQGVDVSKIINNSTINSDNVKDNSVLSIDNVDSTISSVGDTTFMAAQTKVGKKGLAAIGKKITGESVAKSVVKGVPKGGALGLGSLAVDLVNMGGQSLDLWEEGSHTDKLMNVGSKGLEYAGYGALIGSVIPVLGTTVGAAVGGVIGTAVGTFQQYGEEIKEFGSKVYNGVKDGLFGSDNMTESDKIQQQYEETKIGIVDIRDPQLEQKAQLATCQIHDIVVSMWHHMNGKQSNGLEKDKGLLGGVGDTVSNVSSYIGSNIVNQITSPFKFIGGIAKGLFGSEEKENVTNFETKGYINNESSLKQQYNNSLRNNSLYNGVIYGNNSVVSRPNTYYNTKSFIDNISVKNNNNDIISKPTAGEYQYIRETNNYQQQSFNNGLINNKLDLNVSGTIKLTSDRGNSVDIDLNKLLNNPSFINQLTTMISNEMNKRSNFGVGKDYNSVSHIMGGASSRSVLNATTNGAK